METKIQQVINHFLELNDLDWREVNYRRYCKPAKQLLVLCDDNIEKSKEAINKIHNWSKETGLSYSIETIFKRWYELAK